MAPPPPPALPVPQPHVGRLGRHCWELCDKTMSSFLDEQARKTEDLMAPDWDQDDREDWLREVSGLTQLYVMLSMSPHQNKVVTVYGLGQFTDLSGALPQLDGEYFAFIGDGQESDPLVMAPVGLVPRLGGRTTVAAATMQALEVFYGPGNFFPTELILFAPPGGGAQMTEDVTVLNFVPVANHIVHLFADAPHPYTALQRMLGVRRSVPQARQAVLDPVVRWLRAACHRAEHYAHSCLSKAWTSLPPPLPPALERWAEQRRGVMIPPVRAPPPPVPQPTLTEEGVRQLIQERWAAKERTETVKGARRMTESEYLTYLGWAGLDPNTDKGDAPEFVFEWEATAQRDADMRLLVKSLADRSAARLHRPNSISYLPAQFVKDMKTLEFGGTIGEAWARSNRGLTIASVWPMLQMDQDDAAAQEVEDERVEAATLTTTADMSRQQGKPSSAPETVGDLKEAIEALVVMLHATVGLGGEFQRHLLQVESVLKQQYARQPLTTQQIATIYWVIHCCSRRFFATRYPDQPSSDLASLVAELRQGSLIPRVNVPRQLTPGETPSPKRSKTGGRGTAAEEGGGPAPQGFGKVKHYNTKVATAWQRITTIQPRIAVRTALGKAKTDDGAKYTIPAVNSIVEGNRCVIGAITGECNSPVCKFRHDLPLPDAAATALCTILTEAEGEMRKTNAKP